MANADHCLDAIAKVPDADVVLLPELALSGYTCGDLFAQASLLQAVVEAIDKLSRETAGGGQLIVVGAPVVHRGRLYNTAVVLGSGRVLGVVPKQYLPTYREFYESRHFHAGDESSSSDLPIAMQIAPFGIDLLFRWGDAVIAIDICEDLWVPVPPSSLASLAGANVLLNLSASNETIGKAQWRQDLVVSQSGRCIAAYAYASAGPNESTTDLVFGGHCLIAENGNLLGQSHRVGDGGHAITEPTHVIADIDLQRLAHDRRVIGSFASHPSSLRRSYRTIDFDGPPRREARSTLARRVDGAPFVPSDSAALEHRCAEVMAIQVAGLAKRVSRLPDNLPLVIGVSGGLDSTLALLVACRACDACGWPRGRIVGLTMPGFGTTAKTRENAIELMKKLGINSESIDIRQLALDTFLALDHRPLGIEIDRTTDVASLQQQLMMTPDGHADLVFENVQARLRTYLLMTRGFVLGTGDMSEQALGWCTYNADHMSMYNVNTSIPKTLVRFLVKHAALSFFAEQARDVLLRIVDTPISPELLPPSRSGEIRQNTEDTLGAYELHDFFLYHFIRNGFTKPKILFLAKHASFSRPYSAAEVLATLDRFIDRFFASQYKRSCVPDGPKVGSVSLSPRGDWRMPSDAESDAFH